MTHTSAVSRLRPVANAFGRSMSEMATRGFGMSARAHTRSTAPCSSGACSRVTSRAPMLCAAMRSLNQN